MALSNKLNVIINYYRKLLSEHLHCCVPPPPPEIVSFMVFVIGPHGPSGGKRVNNYIFVSIGPGLAIRVLCASEPFICNDFAETNTKLGFIVDYSNAIKKVRYYSASCVFLYKTR